MNIYIRAMRLPFLTGSLVPVLPGGRPGLSGRLFPRSRITPGFNRGGIPANRRQPDQRLFRCPWKRPNQPPSHPLQRRKPGHPGRTSQRPLGLLASIFFFALALVTGLISYLDGSPLCGLDRSVGPSWPDTCYSADPIKFMSRGLGEITIFLAFGPLITWGTYYVMTDQLTWPAFFLGFPLGFLITAVIWINQFPDFQADREAQKRNLVVRLGLLSSRWIYVLLMILPFPFLLFLLGSQKISFLVLLAWLALPLAIKGHPHLMASICDS